MTRVLEVPGASSWRFFFGGFNYVPFCLESKFFGGTGRVLLCVRAGGFAG